MSGLYILNDAGEPVPEPDVLAWGRWFEDVERRTVGKTEVGGVLVSTVFLGIDHAFGGGPPVLWETMIFGNDGLGHAEDYQERYSSHAEAIAGHERAVAMVLGRRAS